MTDPIIEKYVNEFGTVMASLPNQSASWLDTIRKKAIRSIDSTGFPHHRHEEWKYTDISKITDQFFRPIKGPAQEILWKELNEAGLDLADTIPLIFLDGRYTTLFTGTIQLPKGVKVDSLQQALKSDSKAIRRHLTQFPESNSSIFTDLNTAFIDDGAYIHISKNTVAALPIQLVFISGRHSEPVMSQPRNLIVLEKGAQATVIQNFIGLEQKSDYLQNSVTEIALAESSTLTHMLVQEEHRQINHINTIQVRQDANSRFDAHSFTFGGALTRNNLNIELLSEGAECTLNGLYMIDGVQHADNHTRVDHLKPDCSSSELYKGVLDGHARGVFNGKVLVHQGAQRTKAFQKNPNLLLSKNAEIDTKPQLEIFADDVKCSHGATVGQLDDEAVFYLRSRGLDATAARDLLIYAFAEEMIQKVAFNPLKNRLTNTLTSKLSEADHLREID